MTAPDPYPPGTNDSYCDWSFLRKVHCGGKCCLNHKLDKDLEEAIRGDR